MSAARSSRRCENTQLFQGHAPGARRGRVRPAAGLRHGAVRDRDPGEFRARAAARRPAGAAGRGRRHRSGRGRLGARRARPARADRAARTTARMPEAARAAVRDAHARALQPGRRRPQLNIVPGLVGTILTMTMLIFTALSVTREIERGTMESLLSMPITPVEIMLGKIVPYVIVGFVQAALIIGVGIAAVRRADARQPAAAGGARARCSSPPICRSATPSRPSRRTSCRRCRCR